MKQDDNKIYEKQDINKDIINEYNQFIRTGAEFFIPNKLWNNL